MLAAIANTDYEGEIADQGDTVRIRWKPSITISPYEKGQSLAVQRPSEEYQDLIIDKGQYFNTIIDDVDVVQTDVNMMGMWSDDASEQMKIVIDTDVLANIPAAVPDVIPLYTKDNGEAYTGSGNSGASAGRLSANINLGAAAAPLTVDATNAIDYILDCGQVLDEANIPENGRWIILPAWYTRLIKGSELRDASLTGDGTSMLRNGRLGMIDRFTLYASNLQAVDGTDLATSIMFGHRHGLTFASQLTKMETIRSESTFGTLMRGLQVYGYKVIDPRALGVLYAKKA